MTRKDYVLIAKSIRASITDARDFSMSAQEQAGFREGVMHLVQNLASALQTDNARFNDARFLEACGV